MHNIELPRRLGDCHDWWRNFLSEYVSDTRYGVDYINTHLEQYNGKIVKIGENEFQVEFRTPEYFLFFKLKYTGNIH